ncbi:MAG: hypothetical protein HY300_03630 [Verrucomicrobia bacterium]|nr:hypothetical protein [Verrucomicrobiota bacterium]
MWIKIALIFSILASAGTIVLSELKVKSTINTLVEQKTQKAKELDEMSKKKEELAGRLGKKQEELDTTTAALDAAKTSAEQSMKEAATEKANAAKANAETTAAKQETATVKKQAEDFFAFNKPMEEIKKTFAELPVVKTELEIAMEERKILAVRERKLDGELNAIKNAGKEVVMSEGIKGKVVAVDPKWEFCVISVGGNHGVLKNGELLVSRGGKIIGRLKVATVEPTHSVANILPQWKKRGEEIAEGDEVTVP